MSKPRYFARRRVNPLLGPLQVVEVEGARAISPNGARWQVELLSEAAVRQPLWADIGPACAERRFFTYGVWGLGTGMRRLPVNPMLGDQSSHPSLGPLLGALEAMPPLPFPTEDWLELWLLNGEWRPLALVLSVSGEGPPTLPQPPPWQAALGWGVGARASSREDLPPPEVDAVERLIAGAAGVPAQAQWFRRASDGSGAGLCGFRLDDALHGRCLQAADFPELLVRTEWPEDPGAEALLGPLIAWQAPSLLTLERLSRHTRERLERLAAHRPGVLYRRRRLLPEVVNRALVQAALVEAVIRATA